MAKKSAPTISTEAPATDVAQAEAREKLKRAVQDAKASAMKVGPMYGKIVSATMDCILARVKVAVISRLIAETWAGQSKDPEDISKGIGARYIFLARITLAQQGKAKYLKGEKKLDGSLYVSGLEFDGPMAALMSGKVTFTATYRATNSAVKKPKAVKPVPEEAFDSARDVIAGLTVPVVMVAEDGQTKVIKRVPVTENLDAFVGALSALLASPLAAEVTTPKMRRDILDKLSGLPGISDHVKVSVTEVVDFVKKAQAKAA